MSTLKDPFADNKSVAVGFIFEENMRRKLLSAFRCRTVTDMFNSASYLEKTERYTIIV